KLRLNGSKRRLWRQLVPRCDLHTKRLCYTLAISRVTAGTIIDVALFNKVRSIAHRARRIVEQCLLLLGAHLLEQLARLGEIIGIVLTKVPEVGVSVNPQWRLPKFGLLFPLVETVGLIMRYAAIIAIHPAAAIAMVAGYRAARGVYRNLVIVDAKPVALGIGIVEQAGLQHLVRRRPDSGDQVRWSESALLHIRKKVLRIAVQFKLADLDQRIVCLVPDFREVEGMEAIGFRVFLRHHLDEHLPLREIPAFNRVIQVTLVAFAVAADQFCRFGVGQILDALLGPEMELHPEPFATLVIKTVSMATETVHVAIAFRNAAIRHDHRHLMERLWQQ